MFIPISLFGIAAVFTKQSAEASGAACGSVRTSPGASEREEYDEEGAIRRAMPQPEAS
jgi:hypothetical protein